MKHFRLIILSLFFVPFIALFQNCQKTNLEIPQASQLQSLDAPAQLPKTITGVWISSCKSYEDDFNSAAWIRNVFDFRTGRNNTYEIVTLYFRDAACANLYKRTRTYLDYTILRYSETEPNAYEFDDSNVQSGYTFYSQPELELANQYQYCYTAGWNYGVERFFSAGNGCYFNPKTEENLLLIESNKLFYAYPENSGIRPATVTRSERATHWKGEFCAYPGGVGYKSEQPGETTCKLLYCNNGPANGTTCP